MAEPTAKFVRTLAPGGATLNYTGITGNSHKAVAMPLTLIKKALDRGVKVYELIEEKDDDGNVTGYSEVELTTENYAADNGGKAVTAENNLVPDVEQERADTHAAEFAERLAEKGLEIKQRQDALIAELVTEASTDTISGGGSNESIAGGGADSLSGGGSNESLPGSGEDTIVSGGGDGSVEGGGSELP